MTYKNKMEIALEHAKEALRNGEMPIAAVVFNGEKIVSSAHTSEYRDGRFLVHAELKALLEADLKKLPINERRNMQLFVTLEPCMMCLGASLSFFIGEIHYALDAPSDGAIKMLSSYEQDEPYNSFNMPKVYSGNMRDECLELFKDYIQVAPNEGLKRFAQSIVDQ